MRRVPVLIAAAGAAALAVGLAATGGGSPTPEPYATAAAVAAEIPGCEPQSVWGKYAGTSYNRCTIDGRTVSVWMGEPPAEAAAVLRGPGWSVTGDPDVLREVQRGIGGNLR